MTPKFGGIFDVWSLTHGMGYVHPREWEEMKKMMG